MKNKWTNSQNVYTTLLMFAVTRIIEIIIGDNQKHIRRYNENNKKTQSRM